MSLHPESRALPPALPAFVRTMDSLYLAAIWAAGLAIALMSLIIPWGVFTRYVLGTGSQWPEPIAILLMMVFTFIGAACAYRAGGHIAVTMLTERLPMPLQGLLGWLVDGLMAVVSAFVAWYGLQLCSATWGQAISELSWLPVGATYASLPIGAALTLLFVIERHLYGSQASRPLMRYEEQLDETTAAAAPGH
jgi:TRAP-type C4-dicarboxylate transport system permease small subunit